MPVSRTLVLLTVLSLAACVARESHPGPAGEPDRRPFMTQLGSSVETYCFRADGTMIVSASTQAGPVSNQGKYRLEGQRLVMTWASGGAAAGRAELRGDLLLLTPPRGEPRHYKRSRAVAEGHAEPAGRWCAQ